MNKIEAIWRRAGCVGGDCDALFPAPGGHYAILRKVTGPELAALEHQPAAHEEAVFIPADVARRLRQE